MSIYFNQRYVCIIRIKYPINSTPQLISIAVIHSLSAHTHTTYYNVETANTKINKTQIYFLNIFYDVIITHFNLQNTNDAEIFYFVINVISLIIFPLLFIILWLFSIPRCIDKLVYSRYDTLAVNINKK